MRLKCVYGFFSKLTSENVDRSISSVQINMFPPVLEPRYSESEAYSEGRQRGEGIPPPEVLPHPLNLKKKQEKKGQARQIMENMVKMEKFCNIISEYARPCCLDIFNMFVQLSLS